ncbi:MAG: membrane integrity-associated transporter subunit PqiC [Vibrio sp.]
MRRYLAIIALGLLSACSSQGLRSYQLMDSVSSQVASKPSQTSLYVAPVQMSQAVSGLGLVYQVSDTELVQANNNVWAESITQQVRRRLTFDLRGLQGEYWTQQREIAENQLKVSFDKFQGVYTGNAVISGQWTLIQEGKPARDYPFSISVPLHEDGGYQAQVEALSQAMSQLAQQIAMKL